MAKMITSASPSDMETARARLKSGRNEPCPCGSGRKYKKCCLPADELCVRQAAVNLQESEVEADEFAAPAPSVPAANDAPEGDGDEGPGWENVDLPEEEQIKLDQLWDNFDALKQPSMQEMDEFLGALLALPPAATSWNHLFQRFTHFNHPEMPGVFRRIAASLPHDATDSLAFLYWGAAEHFYNAGRCDLLPEIVDGFLRLDSKTYSPDALKHIQQWLLVAALPDEALRLIEHFLPIQRENDDLMGWVVPENCDLLFRLRLGRLIESGIADRSEALHDELRRGIEDMISPEACRAALDVITGQSVTTWNRAQFELASNHFDDEEQAFQHMVRVTKMFLEITCEGWRVEKLRPAVTSRALHLLDRAAYDWQEFRESSGKKTFRNLLDSLRPEPMERFIVCSCHSMMGVDVSRARLILNALGTLSRFACRHRLISDLDAARTEKEIVRLQRKLDGCAKRG